MQQETRKEKHKDTSNQKQLNMLNHPVNARILQLTFLAKLSFLLQLKVLSKTHMGEIWCTFHMVN